MSKNHITFTKRPIPIPGIYRLSYRLAQMVLILKLSCRNEQSSLLKLHCLSWIMKDNLRRAQMIYGVKNKKYENIGFWGIDPAINRVLLYAVADKYIELIDGKTYRLLPKGDALSSELLKIQEFLIEIDFLEKIGKGLAEKDVTALSNKWL